MARWPGSHLSGMGDEKGSRTRGQLQEGDTQFHLGPKQSEDKELVIGVNGGV